jgi:hypothetical protein
LKIEEDLWKEVKIHCILMGKDISDYIEELTRNDLKKGGKK